jgi:hypothetical protein
MGSEREHRTCRALLRRSEGKEVLEGSDVELHAGGHQ